MRGGANFYFADESVLLDLKHLLIEAKQKIPPVLATLESQNDYLELGGIVYCNIFSSFIEMESIQIPK